MNERLLTYSQENAEPKWLSSRRQEAFQAFENLPLPYIERVKFDRWKLDNLSLLTSDEKGEIPDFTAVSDHSVLIQRGSRTLFEQISPELEAKGVIFTDFQNALLRIPDIVEKHLGAAVKFDEDRLSAANAAFFTSGAILYVPDNVEIDQPLEAVFQQDGSEDGSFVKRVLIIAGKNTKLTYLERLESVNPSEKPSVANVVVEVIADRGAQVKFSAIDLLGNNVRAFIRRRGRLLDDASIDWALAVMNDGQVICDFDSDLVGNGSHSEIKAVGISMGRQVQGIDTRVTNYGKNSVGHILQHGVILESGTLTFNGIGHILKGAVGADAQQESRVLMLSDHARSDANPILLIDENDVTAGHAASIGQVDPEDMYYLMSRGLDEQSAKRLVIRGFLGSVVATIPVKAVQEEFVAVIDRKLGNS